MTVKELIIEVYKIAAKNPEVLNYEFMAYHHDGFLYKIYDPKIRNVDSQGNLSLTVISAF